MESTSSVSEGSFLFLPPGFSLSKVKKNKRKLDVLEDKWEKAFNSVWKKLEKEYKDVNEDLFSKVLTDLIKHVKKLHNEIVLNEGILPCELLLTGTNLSDHKSMLSTLIKNLLEDVTPYVALLWSRDSGNIKNTVHRLVQQIIPSGTTKNDDSDDDLLEEEIVRENSLAKVTLQASQLSLSTLASWYNEECKEKDAKKSIVIIFPDFESFVPNILSEFLLLLSSYSSKIPLVLVFGVATTPVAVHQCLPRNVLSQLVIQLFRSEPSTSFLNCVVENIFFSEKCPFRLGGKCMTFLTDVFLFHSFSVHDFLQGFKFCMMEHFFEHNYNILCCTTDDLEDQINLLESVDLEEIRKIASFRSYVEASSKEDRKLLLLDDQQTRIIILELMKDVQEYTSNFHVALKCLHILTHDLPHSPLGRHVREFYCKAVSSNIWELPEYKDCIKLLQLQSRTELIAKLKMLIELLKINSILDILSLDKNTKFEETIVTFEKLKRQLDLIATSESQQTEEDVPEFEKVRHCFFEYFQIEIVEKLLPPPSKLPLHEVVYFDDLVAVRRRISGSPRGSLHLALNDPHYYLECNCCELSNPEMMAPTLPDLSIAYKLHLEYNKIINLYDWLQSFATIVKPNSAPESEGEVDQEVQARFTRAVSELQFLGFIKPSRAKTDHVTRLTWGNS